MPKRLIIAIDCDDVLVPTTEYLVTQYNKLYKAQVQLRDAHLDNNPEWVAVGKQKVLERLHSIQLSKGFQALSPFADAVEVVNALAQEHELHLLTARSLEVADTTNKMIERYFKGCFTGVQHVGVDLPKGVICAQLHADVMIDDNLNYLRSVVKQSIPLAIWFGDFPWQHEHANELHSVQRCSNWAVVREVIDDYAAR